jgi:hypothetical protein
MNKNHQGKAPKKEGSDQVQSIPFSHISFPSPAVTRVFTTESLVAMISEDTAHRHPSVDSSRPREQDCKQLRDTGYDMSPLCSLFL